MRNALTHREIQELQPGDKKRYFDGEGLYVEVVSSERKYFRLKYRFGGKEKTLALGKFPTTSLKQARQARDEAKKLLSQRVDPIAHRAATKASTGAQPHTFETIAREWLALKETRWAKSYAPKVVRRLETFVFPHFGKVTVSSVTPQMLLSCVKRIEERGHRVTAHRVLNACSNIFDYAVGTGRATNNPAFHLQKLLLPAEENNLATITDPKEVGRLLRSIDAYDGKEVTRYALKLAPLLFVRPGELRQAEWIEFDLEGHNPEWHIPASRMKMRKKHVVPLASQSVALLKALHKVTGHGALVFPGQRGRDRPISPNTINAALRYIGYPKEDITGHGFRHMASTLLNGRGFSGDIIERQLAHADRNAIRAVYNHADYLPERRALMQSWADYLDELKATPKAQESS